MLVSHIPGLLVLVGFGIPEADSPQGDTPARRTRPFPRLLAQPLRPAAVLEAFRRGLEGGLEGESRRAKLHHRDSQDSGVASEVSSASRYSPLFSLCFHLYDRWSRFRLSHLHGYLLTSD